MPVLKCPNGKYSDERFRLMVSRIKKAVEDTTTGDIATFIRKARMVKRAVPKKM